MYCKGQVPESTGNRSKIEKTQLLLSKENEKSHLFKIPSFDFDNTFMGSCPHM